MSTICETCGEEIYDGYVKCEVETEGGYVTARNITELYFCNEHEYDAGEHRCEFRCCECCGEPMTEGFMVEGGGWYCCDDCFEPMMNRDYPNGYRANTHDDDPCWCDGMWDYKDDDGKWYDTGIFYTEWY